MDRRRFCALLAAGATAGCGTLSGGPDPVVLDHVRGDVAVAETSRVFEIDGGESIRVVVENSGIDAEVGIAIFWVPSVDLDFEGLSPAQLRRRGHEPVARRDVRLQSGERRVLRFDLARPPDVAGYYVYKNNRTFGAVVENQGGAGSVTVQLVDTTDMADQRVLVERTIDMAAGERRQVTFTTRERYDMFRVDAFAAG